MMDDLSTFREILPLLLPILIIQLVLIVLALRDLLQREQERVRGPKIVWALIILFINLIGPILYFLLAREDE